MDEIRCKYDSSFICPKEIESCTSSSLVDCLKLEVLQLKSRVEYFQKRQAKRNDEQSLKWRAKYFYYKDRCKRFEKLCKVYGINYTSLLDTM